MYGASKRTAAFIRWTMIGWHDSRDAASIVIALSNVISEDYRGHILYSLIGLSCCVTCKLLQSTWCPVISSLKFMTRIIATLPNNTGERNVSQRWLYVCINRTRQTLIFICVVLVLNKTIVFLVQFSSLAIIERRVSSFVSLLSSVEFEHFQLEEKSINKLVTPDWPVW